MSYVVQRQENEYRGKENSLNFPKHPPNKLHTI